MKSLFKLKPYLRPYLPLILTSAALALPLAALRTAPVPFVKYVMDDLFISKDRAKLLYFPAIFIVLYLINFVVRFFHYYCLRIVVARVNQKLKNDLYDHVMGLSADYFTSQSTGALISRVGSDPQNVDAGVAQLNVIVREPIQFLLLFGYAMKLNWKLTLITFAIFPPLAYIFSATGRNLKRYITRMQEENARLFSTLQESFTGFRVIKTFRLEKYSRRKFRERSETFTKYLLKTAVLEEASHPMVELVTALAIAVLIYYGGTFVIAGTMQPGELMAFFTAFALMMNPLRTLNDMNMKLHTADASCKRIFEIFELKSNLRESADPKPFKTFKNEIRFDQVHFAYPDAPQREVLKGLNFSVQHGKALALVGASGAGKSSLVALLPRVFDITQGSITIDGHDIRDLNLDDLRTMISVVSQDVFLFNDTISENIRCGRLSANQAEIHEAAKHAHALEFIESLPDGFETVIGDRGQKLSGGERQRLSIARAFLRQAPILILDEATSSLDSASERAVQVALEELMQNRTTILIAHRLSTIKHADQILVMQQGEVVERGTHDELVKTDGAYSKYLRLSQTQGPLEEKT
ncbi:MAG: ABC transporter ATP-binding protein [Methylotenera sp.]|nr:ABC transporter ATP-binding protein [Oligoflexia bacterium]